MAALVVTQIALKSDAVWQNVQFAETSSVGDAVYFDSSVSKWRKADASASAVAAGQDGVGINLSEVTAADQYGLILVGGGAYVNGTPTQGATYVVGATAAGDIDTDSTADSSNWYKTWLMVCTSGISSGVGEVIVNPQTTGVLA